MELKKNKEYDLEKKSPLFFSIGLVVALACVTLAFEWKSEYEPIDITYKTDEPEEIYVPVATKHKDPEPPKPIEKEKVEKPKSNQPPVVIEADDKKEIENQVKIVDINFDDLLEGVEESGPPAPVVDMPFIIVENPPTFPGGLPAFYEYVKENLKYPSKAKSIGAEGKVYLQFVIDVDGSITEVEVLKGIGAGCDEEAKRVLENAPKFNPGKQRGRAVRVRQVIPIYFQLK